jgi:hypothetical protein
MSEDHGIKIAEAGYSALTADPLNLVMRTDFTLLKCIPNGAGTATLTAGEAQITHNLGYKPSFLVYGLSEYPGDPVSITFMETSNPLFEFSGCFAAVDETKLYIWADPYFTSAYYFIFYEGI